MKIRIHPLSVLLLAFVAAGCGDAQRCPATAESQAVTQVCTEPQKACFGGAIPTTDPATCMQTCPGE
ncbi:MAG TPA: hypothetical protein VIH99_02240 [Bdellovibrionota bacterium]|jgi:hypothetical protein